MNKILDDFTKHTFDTKEKFIHQFGDNNDCIKLLLCIWENNYNNQSFVWIRSIFIENFEEIIPKLNSIGIRVFKREVEDELEERLLTWSDEYCTTLYKFECKPQDCSNCENYYRCVELDPEQMTTYKYWQHSGKNCPDFKEKEAL